MMVDVFLVVHKRVRCNLLDPIQISEKQRYSFSKSGVVPRIRPEPKMSYNPNTVRAIRFDRVDHCLEALPSHYSRCRESGG